MLDYNFTEPLTSTVTVATAKYKDNRTSKGNSKKPCSLCCKFSHATHMCNLSLDEKIKRLGLSVFVSNV